MGEVFDRYTDTAGNEHWCDTETGKHKVPAKPHCFHKFFATETEENKELIDDYIKKLQMREPTIYENLDACTISTSAQSKLMHEILYEIPYVYKRNQTPKITYVVCNQCGAPVMIKSPCCPWCKVPYEWAHELEVV